MRAESNSRAISSRFRCGTNAFRSFSYETLFVFRAYAVVWRAPQISFRMISSDRSKYEAMTSSITESRASKVQIAWVTTRG